MDLLGQESSRVYRSMVYEDQEFPEFIRQLTPIDVQRILDEVARTGKTDAPLVVDVTDAAGEPVASATVTMSVRRA